MQHLTTEALARLVDEPPDALEAAHLDGCPACREELEALRRQTVALAGLAEGVPAEPPPEHWDAIVSGLARDTAGAPLDDLALRRRARAWQTPWFRVAAAVVLYALGTGTGLALRARSTAAEGGKASPVGQAPTTTAAQPSTLAATTSPAAPVTAEDGGTLTAQSATPAADQAPAGRLTSNEEGTTPHLRRAPDASEARTPQEALQYVRAAEQAYAQAYARYTELAQPPQPEDFVTRIAALQSIVLTTQQALDRAPADPVINGYHLTAVAQRDAALRQAALRSSDGRWF